MSCQTPMLWAFAATGLLYWVVSFQASTRISIMLFRSARRGAKGKEATNNVTNPNWITAGMKDKFTSSSLWRGKGDSRPNSYHFLHFEAIYTSKTLQASFQLPSSPFLEEAQWLIAYWNRKEKLVTHSSVLSLLFKICLSEKSIYSY